MNKYAISVIETGEYLDGNDIPTKNIEAAYLDTFEETEKSRRN